MTKSLLKYKADQYKFCITELICSDMISGNLIFNWSSLKDSVTDKRQSLWQDLTIRFISSYVI